MDQSAIDNFGFLDSRSVRNLPADCFVSAYGPGWACALKRAARRRRLRHPANPVITSRLHYFRGLHMRKVFALGVGALLAGGALLAQEGRGGRGMGAAPAGPAPTCPASGYGAQAYYSGFGQNGGDGQTFYEIAS